MLALFHALATQAHIAFVKQIFSPCGSPQTPHPPFISTGLLRLNPRMGVLLRWAPGML
jgi:hypothetical protein